jgi:hypothetical protein
LEIRETERLIDLLVQGVGLCFVSECATLMQASKAWVLRWFCEHWDLLRAHTAGGIARFRPVVRRLQPQVFQEPHQMAAVLVSAQFIE